ncbi:MAG TPA: hypothetical protein VHL11_09900, partial [Phototrophicaceae bacterium]|nr:hypothetical protein [Phototrophicaceae bacterium]
MKNHISKFEYLKILALLTCFSPVILVVSLLIENILNSDIAVQVLNGMWIGLLFAYLSKLFTFSEYTTMHEGWSNNRKNVMLVIHMSYGILIVLILYLTGFLLQLLHFENYNPHQWIDYLQLGGFFAIVY